VGGIWNQRWLKYPFKFSLYISTFLTNTCEIKILPLLSNC